MRIMKKIEKRYVQILKSIFKDEWRRIPWKDGVWLFLIFDDLFKNEIIFREFFEKGHLKGHFYNTEK